MQYIFSKTSKIVTSAHKTSWFKLKGIVVIVQAGIDIAIAYLLIFLRSFQLKKIILFYMNTNTSKTMESIQ